MKAFFTLASGLAFFVHVHAQQTTVPQLNGPDGPDVAASSSAGSITITLSNNNPTSNNFMEGYVETSLDLVVQGQPDTTFNFEGYMVYQLSSCNFPSNLTWNYLQDTMNARLVGQSDYTNNFDTLINHEQALACAPETMVNGANAGLLSTYILTTDAFTGLPFQGGSDYAFTAVAYGHNAYYYQAACTPQLSPFLNGSNLNTDCVTMVGIAENTGIHHLKISPNPAEDMISFNLPGNGEKEILRISDLTGRIIREMTVVTGQKQEISVADLPAGMYSVTVSGKMLMAGKVLVK